MAAFHKELWEFAFRDLGEPKIQEIALAETRRSLRSGFLLCDLLQTRGTHTTDEAMVELFVKYNVVSAIPAALAPRYAYLIPRRTPSPTTTTTTQPVDASPSDWYSAFGRLDQSVLNSMAEKNLTDGNVTLLLARVLLRQPDSEEADNSLAVMFMRHGQAQHIPTRVLFLSV